MGGIRILLLIIVLFFLHCLGRGGEWSILFVLMEREGVRYIYRRALGRKGRVGGG